MDIRELTTEDLNRLLEPPATDEPRTLLHYYNKQKPHLPALCGELPAGGSWATALQGDKVTVGGCPLYEICPACQVRYSYLPTGGAQ